MGSKKKMNEATEVINQAQTNPVVEAPKEITVDPSISPKLAIIARKERALVEKQREFSKNQKDSELKMSELNARIARFEQLEKLLGEDPMKVLEERGWNYQKLTERQLSGGELTAKEVAERMEQKFKSFEDQQKEAKELQEKAQKEAEEQKSNQIIAEFKEELKSFVVTNKEKFKLTGLFDPESELLYDTIDAYYQEHNKVLSNDEAADLVEKYFLKLYEDATNIVKPKNTETVEEKEAASMGVPVKQKPTQTTLTNSMQSTAASFLPPKTEADRMARAMAALDGKK
jgi:hypothetical protein